MKPFAEQIEALMELGYGQAAAQAKVAHDAVLLAMDVCGFKKHSTMLGTQARKQREFTHITLMPGRNTANSGFIISCLTWKQTQQRRRRTVCAE